jgi:hypothetical protein
MGEETAPEVPVSAPQPERKQGIADLMASLKGGKIDPITAMLMMSELRRMDRDEERWELEKSLRTNPQKQVDADELVRRVKESLQPEKKFDVEELVNKLNSSWESRFKEYTHRMETLILGKKLEETEARAKQAETELKETKEKVEQEKLLEEKVTEATTPLKNQITELQTVLAQKTAGMSEEERKNVFQNIGGQIEQAITGEVADTIAKNVSQSLMSAFTPKEKEEVPVTAEGKFDWGKAINKWVIKGLDAAKAIAEKMPARPPPLRQVQPIPIEIPAEMLKPEIPPTITAAPPSPAFVTPTHETKPQEKEEIALAPEVKPEAKEAKPKEVPKPAPEEAKPKEPEAPKIEIPKPPEEKKEETKPEQPKPEAKPKPTSEPKPKTPAKTKKTGASHTTKRTETTTEGTTKQKA